MKKRKKILNDFIRSDIRFKQELLDIKNKRLKLGKDCFGDIKSNRRLTAAIRRHNLWRDIKTDIINADLEDDKRLD